jgi:CBS domain-containing protein
VLPLSDPEARAARITDVPTRPIPVVAAHLSMAAARKVAALRRIALLLVERDDQLIGVIDERALATAADDRSVAAATTPFGLSLRPTTSVAQARAIFIRTRAAVLPVIAGGFVLGAIARGDVEPPRTRPNEG